MCFSEHEWTLNVSCAYDYVSLKQLQCIFHAFLVTENIQEARMWLFLQSENYQKCVNFIKSSENSVLQLVKKKKTFWFNCVWQVFYCSDESAALWRVRKILANSCWQDNKLCSSRLCFAWFLRMDTKVQCVFLQRVIAAPSLLQVSIFTLTTRQKSQKARGKCNSHAPTAVN